MADEPTTGSLDTNIRLLVQRVSITEDHLNRLGDSVRVNSRDINKLEAQTSKNDELLTYRLNQITASQKETSNRYWGVVCGLVVTALITLFEILVKK